MLRPAFPSGERHVGRRGQNMAASVPLPDLHPTRGEAASPEESTQHEDDDLWAGVVAIMVLTASAPWFLLMQWK